MKLTYLIIITLLLGGCVTYLHPSITITSVKETSESGICIYTTNQNDVLNFEDVKFFAKCGIYNVGDTLKLTK